MFTGIVEAIGKVASIETRGGDQRILIDGGALDMGDARLGESIAINGVCLTVVTLDGRSFAADVSLETLACTTLGTLAVGSRVNLERALLPATRLGGHLVSGHVDGVGKVRRIAEAARSREIVIETPAALARYIAAKGSVCIDGVSLTVNAVDGATFTVNIIPHTRERTIIGEWRAGSRVNIEVDVIARYLERLLAERAETPRGIDPAFLKEHGYLDDGG